MRLRFGDVTFDGDRRVLLRDATEIHASPKAFRLLELLLEYRPSAVSKALIQETLWPDTYVSDGGIATLVNELRKAIGDSAREPIWIRSIYGFGYAFEGTADEVTDGKPAARRHAVVWGGETIALAAGENILGRDPAAAILVGHPAVSRHHARILVRGDRATLEDLQSKNGTWCGTQRVSGPVVLSDGDEVRLGSAKLVYRGPSASVSERTKTLR